MSKISKLALVCAVGALAIGAKQIVSPFAQDAAPAGAMRAQISPAELTAAAGVLPESRIESYEWVHPLP